MCIEVKRYSEWRGGNGGSRHEESGRLGQGSMMAMALG